MKNHDGNVPDHGQLMDEMQDRFDLSRYGLSEDQIDDALPMYQDKKDELLKAGHNNDDATRIAAGQAKYTSKLASQYSAKDFRDEGKMEKAYNTLVEGLQKEAGCSEEIAQDFAKQYLINAGKMNGVGEQYIKIPESSKTAEVKIPAFAANVLGAQGINKPSKVQIERAGQLHVKLKEAGYNESQMKQIASSMNFAEDASETEFINNIQVYVDYDKNQKEVGAITEFLGDKASDTEIRQEYIERMEVKKTFGLESKEDYTKVAAIRAYEENKGSKGNRKLAKNIIDGDLSKKQLDDTKQKDIDDASRYKELIEGEPFAMREERTKYGERRKKK